MPRGQSRMRRVTTANDKHLRFSASRPAPHPLFGRKANATTSADAHQMATCPCGKSIDGQNYWMVVARARAWLHRCGAGELGQVQKVVVQQASGRLKSACQILRRCAMIGRKRWGCVDGFASTGPMGMCSRGSQRCSLHIKLKDKSKILG